jgi:hypothetical protein
MAKALTLSDLDFSREGNTPDWAVQLRQDYEEQQNSERELSAQVNAIAKDYASRGEPLSDSEAADLFQALSRGETDWVRPAADFSNVQGTPAPSPVVPQTYWDKRMEELGRQGEELGALGKTALAGLEDFGAGASLFAADNPELVQGALQSIPGASGASGIAGLVLPSTEEEKQDAVDLSTDLASRAAANREEAKPLQEAMLARGGEFNRQAVETAFDIAGSPSSAASLVGGPAAALPFADVYMREYGQARREGLTPEEANLRATGQAVPEGALSLIPAGKLLSKVPGVKGLVGKAEGAVVDSLESRLGQTLNTALQTAKTAIGEGTEEGATFAVQDTINRLQGLVGTDKARQYAQTQVSDDFAADLWRNARAGMAMGAPVGGLEGVITGAREGAEMRTAREEGLSSAIDTNLGNELLARKGEADKADTTLNQDIGLELERQQAEQAKQQAFDQAEKTAAEQKSLEEEAGFQTLERGSVSPTSRVEKYADVVERVPVQPAREVTAEDVAGQRAAAQRAETERLVRVAEGKKIEKARKAKKKAAPVENTPTTDQPTPAPIITPKGKKPAPANVIPVPTKGDKSQTESELDNLAEKMGLSLGMAASKADLKAAGAVRNAPAATAEAPADIDVEGTLESFKPKAKALVKSLAARTKQDSRDLQTVIHQGKLVVAPNAKSIGRQGEGRQAEYDMDTGKMYLYTDHINADDSVASIAAALHEANHALLTPEQIEASAGKLRVAANKGNTHAKEALRLAQADTDARGGDSRFENEELIAYFASNLKAAEGKSLGSVGAVVRDLTSAARASVRKHLNADLDISVGEIGTAISGALGDVAKTETKGRGKVGSLAMIAGPSATNFKQKQTRGETYTGARDFGERFEIPDNQAELTNDSETTDALVDGQGIPLGEVMSHDALYAEYPELASTPVIVNDRLGAGVDGQYDNTRKMIEIAPHLTLPQNAEKLRTLILHETQHAIQAIEGFVPGTNAANFIPRSVLNDYTRAQDALTKVVTNFDLGRAVQTLPAQAKSTWDNMVRSGLAESRSAQAQMFLEEGFQEDSSDRMIQRYGDTYRKAAQAVTDAGNARFDAEQKAFQTYLRDYGETEARNTEFRSRMTPEELAAQAPESTMGQAAGNIPVERTLDTTPYAGNGRAVPESKYNNYQESKATLKDGTPVDVRIYPEFEGVGHIEVFGEDGEGLGHLLYGMNAPSFGEPMGPRVMVSEGARRNGVATLMYETAIANGGKIPALNAKNADRSEAGQAFREARVGTLGMAASQTPEAKAARRAPVWFTSLFRNDKGLGKEINALVENARTSPAADRMRAEQSLGRYADALERMARQQGITTKELNAKISADLDAVDKKSNSYEANKAEFIAAASKYGKAGAALIDLRNQVDDLTMHILRQRAEQGGELTEAEKKRYTTLLNNMGRYTHRMYLAHQSSVGGKFAARLWESYEAKKKGKKLSPAQERNYKLVDRAIQTLIDDSLMIPDDAGLADMNAERVRRMYRTWGTQKPDALSLDQMRDELAGKRDAINGDSDRLRRAAEDITKELIGLAEEATTPIANYYRGSKQDSGILQQRENIPQSIRAVMGEVTSPGVRLLATVGKQAEFVARNNLLLEMRKFEGTDLQPPGSAGTDIVSANKMTQLSGEGWGPLEGWYASSNMKALLGDVSQQLATFEQAAAMSGTKPDELLHSTIRKGIEKWAGIAGASKMLQIVGNPFNFIMNFVGAPRMLVTNGNLNPKNTLKAWKTSADLIAYAINPRNASEAAKLVNKYGVTDSAFIGDIKNLDYRQLQKVANEMSGKSNSALAEGLRKAGMSFKETYAMMDVWSKIANFYHQTDVLTDFYKKNGESKTEDQIHREAADIVNKTNITYKRAAPVIKAIERGGFTQFGTYFYEVFRSELGNVHQGLSELSRAKTAKTPAAAAAMAAQGVKRLGGQTATWAATYYMAKALGELAFGDDDDQWLRKLLPEFMQNQDLLPIGEDEKGNVVFFNVSRIDPIGPMTDIMREAMQPDSNVEDLAKQFLDLYVAPRVGSQLVTAIATSAGVGRPTREPLVQQLYPNGYGEVLGATDAVVKDKTVKAWTNVGEAFLPGMLSSWRDTNARPVGDDPQSQFYSAASYMGAYMYKLNPEAAAKSAGFEYSDAMKNGRKDIKEFFEDRPNATAQDALAMTTELREGEKEQWNNIRDIYKGMQAAGISTPKIKATFKNARISANVIKSVARDNFESEVISKKSIEQYKKQDAAGKTGEEKKEVEKKWKDVWDILKQVQKESE